MESAAWCGWCRFIISNSTSLYLLKRSSFINESINKGDIILNITFYIYSRTGGMHPPSSTSNMKSFSKCFAVLWRTSGVEGDTADPLHDETPVVHAQSASLFPPLETRLWQPPRFPPSAAGLLLPALAARCRGYGWHRSRSSAAFN